jgi:L-ascorbate 6-phosphate lactonase
MKDLSLEIDATEVPPGSFAFWWLAQAGFAFKSHGGTRIYLDAYLSDGVEKAFGFKRLSLAPIEAAAVRAEWIVNSHEHLDHLDLDSLPAMAAGNPCCRFAGPLSCAQGYNLCNIPVPRRLVLEPCMTAALDDVILRTARADHGELSTDALSLLLDFGQARVLFTGDTALRLDWLRPLLDPRPDVVLPCINGAFGNMGALEAAELLAAAAPRLAVPCHFWMFREHGGDPEVFVRACAETCPGVDVKFLTPGEGLLVTPAEVRPTVRLGARL